MHISITGRLGSGKSTIANILKEKHGFPIYSTGAIQREIARRHRVSTLEMNKQMARDLSFDHEIDDTVAKISVDRENETIIFDSRMAWRFAANSFKVFVSVDPFVAAARVLGNQRGEVEVYTGLEDAKSKLIERSRLENERFIEIYGVDYFDYSNYNLVIDSTFETSDKLASVIFGKFLEYCESGAGMHEIIMSPASLYPLESAKIIDPEKRESYMDVEKAQNLCSCPSAAVFEGYHYIIDGHHQVLAAIKNGEALINVEPVDTERHPFYKSSQNLISAIQAAGMSAVHDFEEAGNFRYKSYPGYYSQAACD